MSLEDQIRRMGDARAEWVSTPSWSEVSGGDRGRWLLAAAAVVALTAGTVLVLSSGEDDAPDVDTAGPAVGIDKESPIRRWLPVGGEVTNIEYGRSPAGLFFAVPGQEVALVTTPDDATDPADDDWTWITIDGPLLLLLGEGELPEGPESTATGSEFVYTSTDRRRVWIQSERFGVDTLRENEAALRALPGDVAVIAEEIASWGPDTAVVYAGEPTAPDLLVGTDDDIDGGFVFRFDETDPIRFAASSRGFLRDMGGVVSEIMALPGDGIFNPAYAAFPADPAPLAASETQWLDILARLIGDDPTVEFRVSTSGGDSADAAEPYGGVGPIRSTTVAIGGLYTVGVELPEPISPVFGGRGFHIVVNDALTLSFEPAPTQLRDVNAVVPARMSETEATMFADLINNRNAPTEPDLSNTRTGRTCAKNPEPSAEFLDTATHIAFDRNPLDLDLDGVDDEMLVNENDDGTWSLIASLQTGWTEPLDLGRLSLPRLAMTPGGVPAGTDLDGDGGLEFFVTGYDEGTARLVSFSACELRNEFRTAAVLDSPPVPIEAAPVEVSLGEVGSSATRVTCSGRTLTAEIYDFPPPNDAGLWSWTVTETGLQDGIVGVHTLPVREGPPFVLPPDLPSTTGVVDCTPPNADRTDISIPARPECAGNTAPSADVERFAVGTGWPGGLDIDQDGAVDAVFSYVDETGNTWLMANLGGDNYTAAVRVNWDGYSTPPLHRPNLVTTTRGGPAAYDLTGNGSVEFFIDGFGNTGRSARMVGLEDCRLRTFGPHSLDESVEESFGVLIGVGGNSCAPIGCRAWTTCVDGQLVAELTTPRDAFDPDRPLSEVVVRRITTTYAHADGDFVVESESEVAYFADDPPADTLDRLSGVIECAPSPGPVPTTF